MGQMSEHYLSYLNEKIELLQKMIARAALRHQPTADGKWCVECTYAPWPCPTRRELAP
jgi:hypothetical protein